MKKSLLLSVLATVMPLSMMAQDDDMYFTPKKQVEVAGSSTKYSEQADDKPAYYRGSSRNVDEYNRRGKFWSHYQKIGTDGKGNDVIEFSKGNGVYPDSTYIDTTFVGKYYDTIMDDEYDYRYTQRMSRWDGFYDPWFYSYRWHSPYWYSRWGMYDPWYYGYSGWYSPWHYGYGGWYDPWYYGYGGWYDPWYYGYGGWYGPRYYGYSGWGYSGGYRVVNNYGHSGTLGYYDRGNMRERGTYGFRRGNYDNSASAIRGGGSYSRGNTGYSRGNVGFGSRRGSVSTRSNSSTYTPSTQSPNRSFGNQRSYTPSNSGSSFGGGYSGGTRSSGGFSGGGSMGGGSRGGGGHMGGGRR